MTDLRGADSLLQKAIKKVDSSKKTDTAEVKCFYCAPTYMIIFGIDWNLWMHVYFACITGCAAMHSGAEGFDERGARGYSTGHSAKRGRSFAGQDEEGGVQIPTVWGLQVSNNKSLDTEMTMILKENKIL